MDRRKFLMKMNQKAVFSAISGEPVNFVDRLTDEIRRTSNGPCTDGIRLFDPQDPDTDDMDAVFALTRKGEAVSYEDMLDQVGGLTGDDRQFMKNLDRLIFDRDEVEISLDEDDDGEDDVDIPEDDEEEEDGEEIELLQAEGMDMQSITGYAVRVEDAAPSEELIPLVEKFGIAIRDEVIEFMAQHWAVDEDIYGEGMRGIEIFYRISGGNAWFLSCFTLIPEGSESDYFEETLPAVIANIKWDMVRDSLDSADQSFEVQVGVPKFR